MIACGALAADARREVARHGLAVEVHALPPLLHNRPSAIPEAVEELATRLLGSGRRVAVAYADCGTYGALAEVCDRLGLEQLEGLHCYDAIAGAAVVEAIFEEEPGTYLLTDFLLSSFRRLVVRELGLDRHPELVGDYFANYRRVVWLTERPSAKLSAEADFVSGLLGLPVEVREVATGRVGRSLARLFVAAP